VEYKYSEGLYCRGEGTERIFEGGRAGNVLTNWATGYTTYIVVFEHDSYVAAH
jgi:hypothetical protein